jgi:iron complex outermembrane recepter protein
MSRRSAWGMLLSCGAALGHPLLVGAAPTSDTPAAQAAAPDPDVALSEIVVTATRTGETAVQRTPLAINAFTAQQLDDSGVGNVTDLVAQTPNLNVAQTAANAQIYIRGIGSNNVFIGTDPDVTVQMDGVYIARPYNQFEDFVDIARVEVLRGPQGTLYGRNAVGGTINIITRKPTDQFEAKTQVAAGDYGLLQGQGYVGGPLASVLQVSLSADYLSHDPYEKDIQPGRSGVDNAHHRGVRGQIRVTPNDNIEAITRLDWSQTDDALQGFAHILAPFPAAALATSIIGDYHKVALDTPQHSVSVMKGVSQEINFELSPTVALKSLTAYRRTGYDLLIDIDGTELQAISGLQDDSSDQFSQEIDLNANYARFSGVFGLYYFREKEDATLQINLYQPHLVRRVSPQVTSDSYAAFAQGTLNIAGPLSLVAGVRQTQDHKKVDQDLTLQPQAAFPSGPNLPGYPFIAATSLTYNSTTPKIGINYQATSSALLYVSATKGFKSGGTNYAATNLKGLTFRPETIWSYEAGLKSDWLEHRLRFNVTGFYYDYRDLQVQSLVAPGVTSIGNAATARVKGLEVEATAKPFHVLTLTADYSLLDARYRRFADASVPSVLVPYLAGNPRYNAATQTYDASGKRLNAAPASSFIGSAEVEKAVPFGTAFLRGEYYWQARSYYDPSNLGIASQPAYGLFNLGVGLRHLPGEWSIEVLGKNITDKQYLISIGTNGLVPAGQAGAPRTVMVQVIKDW